MEDADGDGNSGFDHRSGMMTLSIRSCETGDECHHQEPADTIPSHVQERPFSFLAGMDEEFAPTLKQVVTALETIEIELFLPDSRGAGRPANDHGALARTFVATATLSLPTTEALIDLLETAQPLRRLCGFSTYHRILDKHRISRALAEFVEIRLVERSHEALVQRPPVNHMEGHVARDRTTIEAGEKSTAKVPTVATKTPRRCGRPQRGKVRPPGPATDSAYQRLFLTIRVERKRIPHTSYHIQ